jgi:hypothetical protein
MQSHPPGRPRSLTLKKQQELLAHVAHGGTVEEAAQIVGVSLRTVQREAKDNEHFDHDLRLAEHTASADPEKLMQRAARSHWRAAAWLLERTKPDQYGKRPPNSCSPENVLDIASWLIETALESVSPEHRELLYRRMQTVADKALDLLMPHPQKIQCLTRSLANRPMPLSSHEWQKTLPIVGDCDPATDYAKAHENWLKQQAACTPEAICTTRPGDAAISDADFGRRLTLLKRDEPYRPKELPDDYCVFVTPEWKLEEAAPSEEEGAAGALWEQGNSWQGGFWQDGQRLPEDDFEEEEVLSPKMSAATKPLATKPVGLETDARDAAGSPSSVTHPGSGDPTVLSSETSGDEAAREAGPSYEEMVAGIHERRERYLAAIAKAREEAARREASRPDKAKARNWLDQFRKRGKNGNGKAA